MTPSSSRKWNPAETPSFTREEMACNCGTCGGRSDMDGDFMVKLQEIRYKVGPMTINSGFRCPNHPDEKAKAFPGAHAQGKAADPRVLDSAKRYAIIKAAIEVGMVGIGIGNGFVHLDSGHDHAPRPAVWTYGKDA